MKGLRKMFERTRPATVKRVSLGCSNSYDPSTGALTCTMDDQRWEQQPGQSDEEFFAVVQANVLKKEHRIEELVIEPDEWHHRIPIFTELPIVKKFTLPGVAKILPLFQGLRAAEANCSLGVPATLSIDPVRTARKLKVKVIHGNRHSMGALKQCEATHWNVFCIGGGLENDWVVEKFASGIMEVGSTYSEAQESSINDGFSARLVQKYPQIIKIKNKYCLDLHNGTKLVIWFERYRDSTGGSMTMEIIRKDCVLIPRQSY